MKTMKMLENSKEMLVGRSGKEAKDAAKLHGAFYRDFLELSGNSYLPASIEPDDASHIRLPQTAIGAAGLGLTLKPGLNFINKFAPKMAIALEIYSGSTPSPPSTLYQI